MHPSCFIFWILIPTMDTTSPNAARLTVVVFLIAALAIIAGAFLLVTTRPAPVQITINPPLPTGTALPTTTPAPITVYITGAVVHADQTMTLAAGSRVEDAIDAAGGFTEAADRERVNLAAVLRDGDQVHVPERGSQVELATSSAPQIIAINRATVEEIDLLPGIGPSLAERIVAYREANGPFADLEALDAVEGVGPSLLEEIAPLVTFE
jgi:competence protein ComEA